MAIRYEKQYRISAADATTATLVPKDGERGVSGASQSLAVNNPTQIVLTFAATPSLYTVNRIINVELELK